jgi:hypothetical protein
MFATCHPFEGEKMEEILDLQRPTRFDFRYGTVSTIPHTATKSFLEKNGKTTF